MEYILIIMENLRDSSLKENNYAVKVHYVKRVGNTYYFNIERNLKNLKNIQYVSPYRVTNSLKLYYLPLYLILFLLIIVIVKILLVVKYKDIKIWDMFL